MAKSLFGNILNAASQAVKAAERERIQAQKRSEKQRQLELRAELKHQAAVQGFVLVFPRRKQIIDESIAIIETSNNIKSIKSRFDTVMTHYKWMIEQKSKGMPLSFHEEPCGFENSMKRAFNENILRIVEFTYNKEMGSILKTKNTESRQKKTTKLRELISSAIANLKNHENKTSIVDSIREYRTNLNETLKELK